MNRSIFFCFAIVITFSACQPDSKIAFEKSSTNTSTNNVVVSEAFEQEPTESLFDIDAMLQKGSEFYQKGDYNNALITYMKVYEVDSNNVAAIMTIGNLYYDTNQNEKAIEFYEKGLVLRPNDINVRCDMATCYYRLNKLDEAIAIHRKSIDMNANHLMSHYNLHVVLKENGNIQEAAEELKTFNALKAKQQLMK